MKIVAKNIVHEDKIQEFIALAEELVSESRKEEGCIEYGLYQDFEKPFILTFIEEWKDMDAIKTHTETAHYKRIVPLLGEFRTKDKEVHIYKSVE